MSRFQKRLAARVLKVGKSRVWMDPKKDKDITKAITAMDIRNLVKKNVIKKLPKKIHKTREHVKKKKDPGRRKGSKYSRITRKEKWMHTVRPLRQMLRVLKERNQIDNRTYRNIRGLVKGGMFRSRSHLRIYLENHGLLNKKTSGD